MSILHERVHLDTTDHDDSRVPFTHLKSFIRPPKFVTFRHGSLAPFALALRR
jgi:hypothetical protein